MIRKTKKIYYPAGLISLILLPICCLFYLNQRKAFSNSQAMDLAVFQEDNSFFNQKDLDSVFQYRNFVNYRFSGNDEKDKIELSQIKKSLSLLIRKKDTSAVLQITFGNKAKYWTFVKSIDTCYNNDLQTVVKNNEILAYFATPIKPDPNSFKYPIITCGGYSYDAGPENEDFFAKITAQYLRGSLFLNTYWTSALVFLLMCFFAFWKTL